MPLLVLFLGVSENNRFSITVCLFLALILTDVLDKKIDH